MTSMMQVRISQYELQNNFTRYLTLLTKQKHAGLTDCFAVA